METTAVESGVDILWIGLIILGFILLVVLIKVVLIVLDLRRVVPTNQVHIVQRAKQTISYGERYVQRKYVLRVPLVDSDIRYHESCVAGVRI